MMGANLTKLTDKKKGLREETTELNKERFLKAFKQFKGIISYACDAANISRQSYYTYINEDEAFKKEVRDVLESQVDIAEGALLRSIARGNIAAIIFFLKTRGKERGYIETMDVKGDLGFAALLQKASQEDSEDERDTDSTEVEG
jgi:hypothetical protein